MLRCIEPVLSRSGATQVYDPFYSNGSASKFWAHLGWKCLHPNVDFFDKRLRPLLISPCAHFLISQPPASLLPRLFKHDLRLIPRWAILVPGSFCLQPDVHAVGALSSIAICKPVSLCMNGIPVRNKRMTWLIKGVDIPGHSLHTNKGLWFWTLGKGDVFTRAQVADVSNAPNSAATVTLSPLDLTALREEFCELCTFFVEPTNIARAQSAARAICGKLRQSPIAQLGASTVRKLLKCLLAGASLGTAVAEEVVACCEILTSTSETYILRAVISVLPKVVSSHTPMLPRCVRMIVESMVTQAANDKKCISRCKGAISSLLLSHSVATRSAIVDSTLELRKQLGSTAPDIRKLLGVWIDTDRTAGHDHGICQDDFDFLKVMLEPEDHEPLGTLTWEDECDNVIVPSVGRSSADTYTHKTLSWNCDGIRSGGAMEEIFSMLSSVRPDTAFFWETKAAAVSIIGSGGSCPAGFRQRLRELGYPFVYFYWCTQPRNSTAYSGVLALSRSRPTSVSFGIGVPRLDREARVVTIRYDGHTKVGAYAPCVRPDKPEDISGRRTDFENAMVAHLVAETARQPRLVYIGDLNASPSESDVDLSSVVDPATRQRVLDSQSRERGLLHLLLSKLSLSDSYRRFHPQPGDDHTWRQRPLGRQTGVVNLSPRVPSSQRIDLALASESCQPASCDLLPWTRASDHRAIILSERCPATPSRTAGSSGVEEQCPRTAGSSGVEEQCPRTADDSGVEEQCPVATTSSVGLETPPPDDKAGSVPLRPYADATNEVFTCLASVLVGDNEEPGVPQDGEEPEAPQDANEPATDDSDELPLYSVNGHRIADSDDERSLEAGDYNCPDLKRYMKGMSTHRRARVPVTRHRFNSHSVGAVLNDTGAELNLVSNAFVDKIGAKMTTGLAAAPQFQYADGKIGRPIGLVQMDWEVSNGVKDKTFFWVVPNCPYDVILGSSYFDERRATFDYGERRLSCDIGGRRVHYPFNTVDTDLPEAAACLYASCDVSIKPGHHRLVPVSASSRCGVPRGTWGTVHPRADNGAGGFVVAHGVTTLERRSNWVQIANTSTEAILIRRGLPVADFHRQHRDAFDVVEVDRDASATSAAKSVAAAAVQRQSTPSDVCARKEQLRAQLDKAFSETKLKEITFGDELVTNERFDDVRSLINEFAHLWDKPSFDGSEAKHDTKCKIILEGEPNFRARVRSVNPNVRSQIAEEVETQRKMGIIEPSSSPYSSTVLLVPKSDGSVRFCINYRPLNAITKRDGYLMPRVDDSLAALKGSNYFSSLDLSSAFWQIPMDEASKDLTSFATPDGTWRYNRMPFGLMNGPAIFSRFIDGVLSDLKWTVCLVYMDDVLIHTRTMEEHIAAMRSIFGRIDAHGLRFKAKKCFICVEKVKFLGHVVSKEGVSPDPEKTTAIEQMPVPRTKDAMRSALGLFGYYRKFVKDYSKIAHPITDCMKKHVALRYDRTNGDVIWDEKVLEAFELLRSHLLDSPILGHADWTVPFEVHTDACKHGLGAVLCQRNADKSERVIAYASRSLTDAERKYNVHEWECLAILWASQLWHGMYLYGNKFKVVTDNDAVKWLFSAKTEGKSAMRLDKWIISMMDLDFDVIHRKGTRHGNADGLSRNCLSSTCPYGLSPSEPLHGVPAPVQCSSTLPKQSGNPEALTCPTCDGGSCCAVSIREFIHHRVGDNTAASCAAAPPAPAADLTTPAITVYATAAPAYFPPSDEVAWDKAAWVHLQSADPTLRPVIGRLETGETVKGLSLNSDGILVNTIAHPSGSTGHSRRKTERLVVPDSLKAFVLWRHHGLPLAGHNGRKRVYEAISRRFWWKGMWKTTRDWVRVCTACCRKFSRPSRHGEPKSILCSHPFEMVCIDLLGPLPETRSGNKYLLTMLDCFTRWPIIVPIPDTIASTVSQALFTHLLSVHGSPIRILSDRGKQLIGAGVTHLCKTWDIQKIATTGHQPQSVPVERFHRYLNSALTCLHGRFGANWDAYVDAVSFTYRISVNDTTGYSPFKLVYGREPVQPDDLMFLPSEPPMPASTDPSEYAKHNGAILAAAYKDAYDRQIAQTERNAMLRQERAQIVEFFPGQSVFYYQPNNSNDGPIALDDDDDRMDDDDVDAARVPNRLRYDWTGPHEVLRKSQDSDNVYVIRHKVTAAEIQVNVNRLRLHERWSDDVESTVRDPSSDAPEHEVGWKVRGRPEVGDLFVFPLPNPDLPFGVGKLLERRADGSLHFQWLSNATDNIEGTFRQGWIDSRDGMWTYGDKPPSAGRKHYKPFTELDTAPDTPTDDNVTTDDCVVVYGFAIDSRGRLPLPVRRILHSNPCVDWEMPS